MLVFFFVILRAEIPAVVGRALLVGTKTSGCIRALQNIAQKRRSYTSIISKDILSYHLFFTR